VKVEGDDDSWDFGTGAGFYVDATEEKWKTNYNMYTYVTQELPVIVEQVGGCACMRHTFCWMIC
jgi:S-formylglutathione hydrolase